MLSTEIVTQTFFLFIYCQSKCLSKGISKLQALMVFANFFPTLTSRYLIYLTQLPLQQLYCCCLILQPVRFLFFVNRYLRFNKPIKAASPKLWNTMHTSFLTPAKTTPPDLHNKPVTIATLLPEFLSLNRKLQTCLPDRLKISSH